MSNWTGISNKQPGPPPPAASCYICLENSEESNNQPLLRNCACRGDDAGWAHVACLAKFAASKAAEALHSVRDSDDSVDIGMIWKNCILCKTPYMQNMGLAMAEACVKIYEDLPEISSLRMFSFEYMASINVDLGNYNDALKSFNRLLEIIKFATEQGHDVRRAETRVLMGMSLISMDEQRYVDTIALIEREIEITIDLDGPNSSLVRDKKRMLTMLQGAIGEGRDHKMDTASLLVRARQQFKEKQKDCDDVRTRLSSHMQLVNALVNDGKTQEATEQMENLLSESRRDLGPDHPVTLHYENTAEGYCTKMNQAAGGVESQKNDVWAVIDYEKKKSIHGQRVKVLRATKDAQKYVCLIKNNKGVSSNFKVAQHQFILEAGTTVAVHGLVSSTDLNGSIGIIHSFDKEKRRYAVSVGKKKTVSIKPINLNIVFNKLVG